MVHVPLYGILCSPCLDPVCGGLAVDHGVGTLLLGQLSCHDRVVQAVMQLGTQHRKDWPG